MASTNTSKPTKKFGIHYNILPHNAQRFGLIVLINIDQDEAISFLAQNGLRIRI